MTLELDTSLDTEKIQRAAILILYSQLNEKLDELEAQWNSNDEEFFNAMDKVNPGWSVEHIQQDNFHAGTITQIADRGMEEYPNVCAIAYLASPRFSNDDHGEQYRYELAIEILVKSNTEGECNSRIQKTLDAAHQVMFDSFENRTLGGIVHPLPAPEKSVGDVFPRRLERSHGDKWYWQGGRLLYNMDKFISFYQ